MKDIRYVFIGKAARVFVFGLVSVMTPFYVHILGYSAFYVGLVLAAIAAGNVFSNLLLTWYESYLGRRRFLLLFSALMLISGVLLYATSLLPVMLLACFLGNISVTGTEAGPFQSIETGMLPSLVPEEKKNRAFGIYNLIGYGASSLVAFGASLESLGFLFLVVNIITAVSTLAATFLADRIGNLRTMVYTHLLSNVFLVLIPLAGSFPGSVALLLLRQSVSQMDVPTRQAFMSEVFGDRDRVSANAITNTFRSVGSLPGAPLNGILLSIPLVSAPLLIAASVKIVYDFLIYSGYSKRAT